MKYIFAVLLLSASAAAQASGTATMALFDGPATGACNPRQLAINTTNGDLYTCANSAWVQSTGATGPAGPTGPAGSAASVNVGTTTTLSPGANATVTNSGTSSAAVFNFGIPQGQPGSGGGGNGTVTSFSAGNLSPLFTTSVASSTTTPALSFSFSNAPAGTMLGNNGSSAAPPSWISIPTGGGGSGLTGCQTATPGNLTCDNSVAVTSGTGGTVQLLGAALPTPPSTVTGALAADTTGAPFWSPGSNTAFTRLATTTDVSNALSGALTPGSFTNCNMMGWSTQAGAQTCADLTGNLQSSTTYTISSSDINRVIMHNVSGAVTDTLPPPTGSMAPPFLFWVDTLCKSTVTITGSTINGASTLEIGACGWSMIWAGTDGASWHAQTFQPPGGVSVIQ